MSARIDKTRNPRSRYVAARRVKPMLDGLGALPLDYVFAGAQVIYQATVGGWNNGPSWRERMSHLEGLVRAHYHISNAEDDANSGSIFFLLTIAGDMRSINDIKSTMDSAVYNSGFPYRGSMVRFVSNPRRDGQTQPPVNTPGVPPPVTKLPPAAGNVDTRQPGGVFQTAFDAYFGGLSSKLGISSTTLLILAGLGLVLIIKR